MVAKDLTGMVTVEQSDHMVREMAQGLGTVGFFTGLAVFPLIPLTVGFGAAVGGVLGEALHLVTETKVKSQGMTTIPIRIIRAHPSYPRSSADAVEPVVTRAVIKVTDEARGHHIHFSGGRSPVRRSKWRRPAPSTAPRQLALAAASDGFAQVSAFARRPVAAT